MRTAVVLKAVVTSMQSGSEPSAKFYSMEEKLPRYRGNRFHWFSLCKPCYEMWKSDSFMHPAAVHLKRREPSGALNLLSG